MKAILFLLPLAALSLSACGYSVFDAADDIKQGSSKFKGGKPITEAAATTAAFTKLEAFGPDNIVFTTGSAFQISARGDTEALKDLRYKVEDGVIMIGRENEKWWGKNGKGATVTVTAPTLSDASLAGSGNFSADKMSGDKVVVEIAGSGDVSVTEVVAKSLESDVAGTGDVVLAGKVDRAEYSVAGTGSVDAVKLISTNVEVSIAGTGDVDISATGNVDASIAGSGNVTVTGGAKCISSTVGSGSVNCG